MTIFAQIVDGNICLSNLSSIENYRIPQLRKTLSRYQTLLDLAPITMEQLAARIRQTDRSLRASVNADYLTKIHQDSSQHLNACAA